MGYFEPPPAPPGPEPRETPGWVVPPSNVLPGSFPLDDVLVHTDELVVQVHTGRAYAEGFEFILTLILRNPRTGFHDPLSPDGLRFGIEFSDGRKATTLDHPPIQGEDNPAIVLRRGSGSGNGYRWDSDYWAWPTPPPGPLAFVVDWPAENVPQTRTEIDAERIREASMRAKELWPRDPSDRGDGGATMQVTIQSVSEETPEGSDPGQTPDVA